MNARTNTTIEEQKQRVMTALDAVRQEVKAYRQLAKSPPTFLKDGIPERLRADALTGAALYPDRFAMIKALVSGGVGAEVGVQQAIFSRFLLDEIGPETLYLLDMTAKDFRPDVMDDPRTKALIGDSSSNLATLPDQSLDWIYVDGDHRMTGVQKDTDVARQKIKPGGVLIFNDYTPWSVAEVMPYGVMPVVNALVNEGYPVLGLAIAPHGYYDIAVRYAPL
ncbi:class I SAM-dependent methyltransferase [Primorskyibacter sp. 2E107]|uniref:class I SAM-dependent methyltransferase n=1 Tax=Primorskyibacter sp. 2E107 TaxID=3403458 RepID=UPI003AF8C6CE